MLEGLSVPSLACVVLGRFLAVLVCFVDSGEYGKDLGDLRRYVATKLK